MVIFKLRTHEGKHTSRIQKSPIYVHVIFILLLFFFYFNWPLLPRTSETEND